MRQSLRESREFTFAVNWLFQTIATEKDLNYIAKEKTENN